MSFCLHLANCSLPLPRVLEHFIPLDCLPSSSIRLLSLEHHLVALRHEVLRFFAVEKRKALNVSKQNPSGSCRRETWVGYVLGVSCDDEAQAIWKCAQPLLVHSFPKGAWSHRFFSAEECMQQSEFSKQIFSHMENGCICFFSCPALPISLPSPDSKHRKNFPPGDKNLANARAENNSYFFLMLFYLRINKAVGKTHGLGPGKILFYSVLS